MKRRGDTSNPTLYVALIRRHNGPIVVHNPFAQLTIKRKRGVALNTEEPADG